MIVLDHSTYDQSTIADALGSPEYSYWFVRKSFRRVLSRFGILAPVASAESDAELVAASARQHDTDCVLFSFNPPHYTPAARGCAVVPVFAWEFDSIPDQGWTANRQEDWRVPLARTGLAVTHSRFAVDAVRRTMGDDFPVWSIPSPVFETSRGRGASARGWHDRATLSLGHAIAIDSWSVDLRLFGRDRPAADGAAALRALRRAVSRPAHEPQRLVLDGVVYTSVFNPGDGRKNWDDMIAGFVLAFRDRADAVLILKLTFADLIDAVQPILEHMARLGPFACRIVLIHGLLSDADYGDLVGVTSYALNTSQGEGQCLPLMEFMSAGRPAVAPLHTAMLDYLSADDGFLVPTRLRPGAWPHDERQAQRCLRHEIAIDGYVEALRRSHAVAAGDADRYGAMSAAAVAAQAAYCGDDVVVSRLGEVFDFIAGTGGGRVLADAQALPGGASRGGGEEAEPVDPYMLGLRDAALSGWYDRKKGALFTGFPVGPDDVVVDVGCGDGGAAAFCARQGAHVVLVDLDAPRLEAAAERLRADGARHVDVHVSDADPLPLATGSASRVVCTEVIEHVDDPDAFVAELVRIGAPGALYLITVPGAAQEHIQKGLAPPSYFEKPNHIRILEQRDFHALIERNGLTIERSAGYGFYWSIWFALFWQADVPLGGVDPTLQSWADTWSRTLDGRDGMRIKAAFDALLPKSQVVVARKPA